MESTAPLGDSRLRCADQWTRGDGRGTLRVRAGPVRGPEGGRGRRFSEAGGTRFGEVSGVNSPTSTAAPPHPESVGSRAAAAGRTGMPAAHPSRLDPTPVARRSASSRTAVAPCGCTAVQCLGSQRGQFPPPEENLFPGGAEHRILGRPGAPNRASGAGKMGPIDIPTEFQRCPWTQSSPCRVSAMPAPLSRFQVPPRARKSADSSFRGISAQLACIDMCNLAPFPYKRSFRKNI